MNSKKPPVPIALVVIVAIIGLIVLVGGPIMQQDVQDAGAYSPEVSGIISEINPLDHNLVIIADSPCLSYNTGDRLKISLRQTLWDSFFSGESAPTIGSCVSIWLFPVGSDDSDLVGMSIEVVD